MLIVNHDQLRLAGIASLEERCTYCSKTLAAYPLIMSDDANQTVYHVTCALELASDLLAEKARYSCTTGSWSSKAVRVDWSKSKEEGIIMTETPLLRG